MDQAPTTVAPVSLTRRPGIERRRFLAVGALLGSAVAVAACSAPVTAPTIAPPTAPPTAPPAKAPDKPIAVTSPVAAKPKALASQVRMAATSINPTLDPHGTLSNSGYQAARQVFDALVSFDDKGEQIVPQLATAWQRIDANTLELKLRDDVRFSNGEPFTAETVKFNVERVVSSTNPIHSNTKIQMGSLAAAEVVNSTTVRVKTKDPDPLLLNRMCSLFMLAPKFAAEGGDANTRPVGTGSFKVAEFQPAQRIVYEAWDGSWRGRSPVQQAIVQAIPEPATMNAALKAGQVDIVFQPPADQVAGLQRDGFNVQTVSASSCTICSLIPAHPLTQDKRIREAINLAVNKEEILKTVQAGLGKVAQGQFMQPGMLGYRPDLTPVPYDPERAKALVKEAGAEGAELPIMVTAALKPYVDAIVGYLGAVGLRGRADLVELGILVPALTQQTDRPMLAWNTDYFSLRDFDPVGTRFSDAVRQPHFENAEFNETYKASRQELDPAKRSQMIGRLAELMRNEFGVLFLIWRDFPWVYTKQIARLDLPYDTSTPLWKVQKEA